MDLESTSDIEEITEYNHTPHVVVDMDEEIDRLSDLVQKPAINTCENRCAALNAMINLYTTISTKEYIEHIYKDKIYIMQIMQNAHDIEHDCCVALTNVREGQYRQALINMKNSASNFQKSVIAFKQKIN